jgi:hypothetical protein
MDLIRDHFEMFFLLALFVIGCLFLVGWPDNEALIDWIKSGIVIGVIARALQGNGNGKAGANG